MTKRVLNVGNCGFDHDNICRMIQKHFDAEVIPAATADDARDALNRERFDLILVNRILAGDPSSGVEWIRQLKADAQTAGTPMMLVSNHADAQQEAVDAGAATGFGKAELGDEQTADKLRPFLDDTES
jgi:DNA-binding response OmpR family regulator